MKNKFLILNVAGLFALLLSYHESKAQISTDLSTLPQAAPPSHNAVRSAENRQHHSVKTPNIIKTSHDNDVTHPLPKQNQETKTIIPAVPTKAPLTPILSPAFAPVEKHPPVQPEIITPVAGAKNHIISLDNHNLRIVFSQNATDFNQDAINSIHNFGLECAKHPEKRLLLKSYASTNDDDVSMPKRTALKRALTVRALLMQASIASTRIYPIVYGQPQKQNNQQPSSKESLDYLDIIIEENPKITTIPFPTNPMTEKAENPS